MTELLVHERTVKDLKGALENPGHAWLIVGDEGSGAGTVGKQLICELLELSPDQLEPYPYFSHVMPEKTSISIEQIRELKRFLSLKTAGEKRHRRAVLIECAETMPHEAQNALLKILEEPPADTILLLTTLPGSRLLPTIHSRVRQLRLKTPPLEDCLRHFRGKYSDSEIKKAYMMSNGQQELMSALLEQNTSHPLVAAIQQAKEILGSTPFERLGRIDELIRQKSGLLVLLQACSRVIKAALEGAVAKNSPETVRWLARLKAVQNAQTNMERNPNQKLLLADLMVKL